jgi:hypothetical protein
MNTLQAGSIPYEKQADPQNSRLCGAASLSMVYRSLGKTVSQGEIWPKIARFNNFGHIAGITYLLAQDALLRGFAAVAVQTHQPLRALRCCQDHGIRAVLNHRLSDDVPTGHFSVLVGLEEEHVILHDPHFGPSRRVRQADLLGLWRPRYLQSEILGNVLIGIAPLRSDAVACRLCQAPLPASIPCPQCAREIPLQPAVLVGCMRAACPGRLWERICCPYCGQVWTDKVEPAAQARATAAADGMPSFEPAFAALDAFTGYIKSVKGVGDHPEVKKLLEQLESGKAEMKIEREKAIHQQREQEAELAKLQQKAQAHEEAIAKVKEEMKKKAPTPNANELGRNLIKEMGLMGEEVQKPIELPPELKPVKKEPPPPKKEPAKVTDHELVRKALEKPGKPKASEDFESLKLE